MLNTLLIYLILSSLLEKTSGKKNPYTHDEDKLILKHSKTTPGTFWVRFTWAFKQGENCEKNCSQHTWFHAFERWNYWLQASGSHLPSSGPLHPLQPWTWLQRGHPIRRNEICHGLQSDELQGRVRVWLMLSWDQAHVLPPMTVGLAV